MCIRDRNDVLHFNSAALHDGGLDEQSVDGLLTGSEGQWKMCIRDSLVDTVQLLHLYFVKYMEFGMFWQIKEEKEQS